MIELLMRYDIKPVEHKGKRLGEKHYTIYCNDCHESKEPFKISNQPKRNSYSVDKNNMVNQWAKMLNEDPTWRAENVQWFCFIHYMSFVFRNCDETLEMVHDYFCNGGHP